MKTLTLIALILTLGFSGFGQGYKSGNAVNAADSVVMGPGYANDIYYSFEDGVVKTVSRTNWDIGFRTTVWTASIITNGAAGVDLYTYPNADTTGWSTVDTTGLSGWPILYNDENDWENGAFDRNATGHPDYGWGKYNPINHDVVGDSIYILKTIDGTFKKLWIVRKNSSNNRYFLREANLDGSDDHTVELDINPYLNVNFIYYDFAEDSFVEREPDTASWDILYTKYMAIQPNGDPYPVVGVFDNDKVYANEFYPVAPDFMDYMDKPFDSTKSPIGWEWKSFDMNTFTWTVADSTAFFVKSRKHNVFKLVYTRFDGTGTGIIGFNTDPVTAGIFEPSANTVDISVYPNPVRDQVNIALGEDIRGSVNISIYDLTGKLVFSKEEAISGTTFSIQLPESIRKSGLYIIKAQTDQEVYTSKFMVRAN